MRNLRKSIVIMAGVYASTFDTKIIINEQGIARTTPDAIYIPKPKEEYLHSTWGYVAHEAAHKRFTELSYFSEAMQVSPTLKWVLNVIEDTVIERKMLEPFPGVFKYFNTLATQVLTYQPSEEPQPEVLVKDYIFHYVRGYLTGYDIWDENTQALEEQVSKQLGYFVFDALVDLLNEVRDIDSTEGSFELAEQIITFLAEQADQEEPEDDSDDSQGDDSDDSQGDGSDDSQGDDSDDSQNGKGSGDSLSEEGKQIIKAFTQATESDLGNGDTGSMAEELLSDPDSQDALTEAEQHNDGVGKEVSVTVSDSTAQTMATSALAVTSNLRHSLLRLLEDQTRSQRETVRRGRKIAKSKVHRLATGNTRIFKRKFEEREGVDCDVVVLADASGSMGNDIESVKIATYSLLQCLSQIDGCNTACLEFGYNLGIIQKPREGFTSQVKGRIASITPSGGTPATEAYWASAHALCEMQGRKKVAIMVTDGQPNNSSATKEMVELLRENGVIVLCLGVGLDRYSIDVLDYVYGSGQWQHIKDFNELPRHLLEAARQVL